MASANNVKLHDISKEDNLVKQGDVFKDISYTYRFKKNDDNVEIIELTFPYVLVLSQSCDVLHAGRLFKKEISSEAKMMFSVIVVPIIERNTFISGEHLSDIKEEGIAEIKISNPFIDKHDISIMGKGMHYRYHEISFEPANEPPSGIIDFKEFFTLTVDGINNLLDHRIGRIDEISCQQIVNKFVAFLSRVGLPDPVDE